MPDPLDDDLLNDDPLADDDDAEEGDELAKLLADEPLEVPPQAMPMRNAVYSALIDLVAAQHIDIPGDKVGDVADEATLAALEAKNPRHALKKLRLSIINSDTVDEVYCDDLTLEEAFRKNLGG